MDEVWRKRYDMIRFLGWLAVPSPLLLLAACFTHGWLQVLVLVSAMVSVMPVFCYVYVVVIWHWKARYRGNHSDLWGALILIETSGWSKLVYLFRHLIPDMRQTGRYKKSQGLEVLLQP